MRARCVLASVFALGLLGCGGTSTRGDGESSAESSGWAAPQDYRFVVDSDCGERDPVGVFRVVVRDGEVSDARALDKLGKMRYSRSRLVGSVPTLTDLEARVQSARDRGADVATITYGPPDGQPVRVRIDENARVTDDEECYLVSKYSASK